MRLVAAVVCWTACCPPQAEPAFGEVDGTPFLSLGEELEDGFSDRVLATSLPRVRLTPTGPDLPGAAPHHAPLVVVDPGPWPRVGLDTPDVRVLVYLDRAALQRRVVAVADGPVALPVGKPVELVDESEESVRVEAVFDQWTASTWVPRSAVDEVWSVDASRRAPHELPDGDPVVLVGQAEVRDTPSGDAVAWLHGEADTAAMMAVQTGDPDGGWVPVAFADAGARVTGWVFEDDLLRDPPGFGFACTCGGSSGGSGMGSVTLGPTAVVPAGTLLRAGPEAPVVAMALRELRVPLRGLEDGATLERWTPLGRVSLWVDAWDVVP